MRVREGVFLETQKLRTPTAHLLCKLMLETVRKAS